jgi:hypothetical protein
MQSLADVAREEAERRRLLDQQGVEAKVIVDVVPQNSSGSLTLSTGPSSTIARKTSKESTSSREKTSLNGIRASLQKLDRSIKQTQERLEVGRARLHAERWAIPKTGRVSARGDTEKAQSRLRQEMEALQKKLDQLQQDRSEIYDRGKKAGFLPGELTGKGIIP